MDYLYTMTDKHTEHWGNMGKEFGYPQCCIDQFCSGNDFGQNDKLNKQYHIHQGYGFIPCDKHAEMIDKGDITLESLIDSRTHPIPFPNDITDEVFGEATVRAVLKKFLNIQSNTALSLLKAIIKKAPTSLYGYASLSELDNDEKREVINWFDRELSSDKPSVLFKL